MDELVSETLVKSAIELTIKSVSNLTSNWESKLRTKFKGSFKTYIEHTCKQCLEVRNLINKNDPFNLTDIYVEPPFYFYTDKKKYDSFKTFNPFEKSNRIFIKGTAGLGKSTLCKYLYLHFVQNTSNGIPLFFEFRNINTSKLPLWDFLIKELRLSGVNNIKSDHISELFKSGKFILIFDGLDEVDPDIRIRVEGQLRELLKECKTLRIIISSRPDERLTYWESFRVIKLLPFSREKSIELIEKIDFDESIKSEFIELIKKEEIYNKFKSFLSNPLLTSIMFITYDEFGYSTLSNKPNIFYENAVSALLVRHDGTKPRFHRKFYSRLGPDDIKEVAETFCVQSYTDRAFSFTESETIEYINRSKKLTELSFENRSMLKDFTRSMCLLHQDGLKYTFTHRSFQEYLSAVFLSRLEHDKRRMLFMNVLKNIETDHVIELLYAIKPQVVIKELAIPLFKQAIDQFSELKTQNSYLEALVRFYAEFKVVRGAKYELSFRNANSRIKLLKVIAQHSQQVKILLSKFPTKVVLTGKKLDLETLVHIPLEYKRKTYNLDVLNKEKDRIQKMLKLQSVFEEVQRIYKSCLVHFNTEIQNNSDRIFEYLIKDESSA